MSISSIPAAVPVKILSESLDGSPNPTQKLQGVVSVAFAALAPDETVGPSLSGRTVPCEITEPSEQEKEYVAERKAEIVKGFKAWKVSYQPSPSLLLSFIPRVSSIIRKQCSCTINILIDRLQQAKTRGKILSVLEKNRKILLENTSFMNAATERKMLEACALIEGEVKRLREFGPLPPKEAAKESKGVKPIRTDDPLYDVKSALWNRFEEWERDFVPTPLRILSIIPGISAKMKGIMNRLFGELFKDIRRAATMTSLTEKLNAHRELMMEYTAFVDAATAAKMKLADALLTIGPESEKSSRRLWSS